jgi:hypothetical protein
MSQPFVNVASVDLPSFEGSRRHAAANAVSRADNLSPTAAKVNTNAFESLSSPTAVLLAHSANEVCCSVSSLVHAEL